MITKAPVRRIGDPMRYLLCALLFGCLLPAQDQTSTSQPSDGARGAFYVDGIVYQYAAGRDFTVVVAAHPVLNHKFVGVKVRVYNRGQHSVTVKPEDIVGRRGRRPRSCGRLGR